MVEIRGFFPMQRIPMTSIGYAKIQKELRQLKTVDRFKNIDDIEEARAHGDLSENAEYQYAKEKQALIAGQIKSLEDQMARAEVINPATIKTDKIVFGATVGLYDMDTEQELTYTLVGPPETDTRKGRISIFSPIARALIGKVEGDEVTVPTPNGERNLEVLDIRYEALLADEGA